MAPAGAISAKAGSTVAGASGIDAPPTVLPPVSAMSAKAASQVGARFIVTQTIAAPTITLQGQDRDPRRIGAVLTHRKMGTTGSKKGGIKAVRKMATRIMMRIRNPRNVPTQRKLVALERTIPKTPTTKILLPTLSQKILVWAREGTPTAMDAARPDPGKLMRLKSSCSRWAPNGEPGAPTPSSRLVRPRVARAISRSP